MGPDGSDKKQSYAGCILKAEPRGFAVISQRREKVRATLTFLVWAAGRAEFPFTDTGRAMAEQILQGKDRICFGAR